jgi:hypothetical protein
MSKLSLSQAWDETLNVLARDGRLFLAVALALFVLPGLILNVVMPEAPAGEFPPPGPWMAVGFVAVLVWLVGQLAVIRLSLEPHAAVGEAIMIGLKRLLPYAAAVLLWLAPILVVGSALSAFLAANRSQPSLLAAALLVLLALAGLFLAVRLILSSAVAGAEHSGPLVILRRSWDLSSGNWWRLFAFVLLFWIGAVCLLWSVETVAGLLVRLMSSDTGPLTVGGLLIALVSQVVSAAISVMFFVFLARIYAQRSGAAASQPGVPRSGT